MRPSLAEEIARIHEFIDRDWADVLAQDGRRITAIEPRIDNGRPFPDLLIYIEDTHFEGERVVRYNFSADGHSIGAGDAHMNIALYLLEATPREIERLALSNRHPPEQTDDTT